MAYMNQEKKAVIKANLDKILKPLGIKYSLRVQRHSSITCTIQSSPIDFIGDSIVNKIDTDYTQCNLYWIENNYINPSKDIILKIREALRSADYYDNSDAQIDYFDTAYYYYLNFGSWDKPFIVTQTEKVAA
jgi:hypothetical protein